MLMRGSMENNIRTVCFHNAVDTVGITDGAYKHRQRKTRTVTQKLLLNIVRVIFVYIENNKSFRLGTGDLTAKLASDRAASSRDEHGFSLY